jgi:hypothetical protein
LNNIPFHNQWVIEEIRERIKKIIELNENENSTYYNHRDRAKAVLRRKFTSMSA